MRTRVAAAGPLAGALLAGALLGAGLLAGCGARATTAPPVSPSLAGSLAGSGATADAVTPQPAAVPAPAPPAAPRPVQPVVAATADADATLRAQMSTLLIGCTLRGFSNCHRLGTHYLDATGTPATVSVADLLAQLPTLRALVAARLAGSGGRSLDTGWQPYASPAGTDWAYALGHFSYRLVVVPDGDRVRYRTFVADVYDFDPGRPFAQFRLLADHGRAAEFLVTGASATIVATPGAPLRW